MDSNNTKGREIDIALFTNWFSRKITNVTGKE